MISALTFLAFPKISTFATIVFDILTRARPENLPKNVKFFGTGGGGRDSLPRVLRAGETGLQTLNIARCCCQASSLEGLRESQRNVEGHVLSNNRRKEIEDRTGEREVKQRKGLRRSISIISSFSIDDMSLVAPEVKQLSIRSQSKALVSMRYQSSIFL